MEAAIWRVAENTSGYTRTRPRNKWFDKECEVMNEKKNPKEQYRHRQTGLIERYLFRKTSRQLEEDILIEIEQL
jgi:hypothetical protein